MNAAAAASLSSCPAIVHRRVPLRARASRCSKGATGVSSRNGTRTTTRAAMSPDAPAGEDGERSKLPSDPFSAMMNFISGFNPLASVFSSPTGGA